MKSTQDPKQYSWYSDRPTVIALISGFFSSVITVINAFFR